MAFDLCIHPLYPSLALRSVPRTGAHDRLVRAVVRDLLHQELNRRLLVGQEDNVRSIPSADGRLHVAPWRM